jgi:hypothetical protein
MFAFQSPGGTILSPSEWLTTWSFKFQSEKFPGNVYRELVTRGMELSGSDFEVLGAWKDGALRNGAMEKFGNCSISFTGAWKPNAVAAYTVWRNLPQSALVLAQYLEPGEVRFFSRSPCDRKVPQEKQEWFDRCSVCIVESNIRTSCIFTRKVPDI